MIVVSCNGHSAPGDVPFIINGTDYYESQTIELKDVDIDITIDSEGSMNNLTITINT